MRYALALLLVLSISIENSNMPILSTSEDPFCETYQPEYDIAEIQTSVESYFETARAQGLFNGAAICIVTPEEILFQDGFGYASINNQTLVDEETVFRLGSVSKSFAGILSGTLVDQGLVSWDDPVKLHLPEITLRNKYYEKELKLGHLLSHSSGLPYHCYTNLVESGKDLKTIAKELGNVKELSKPGTQYNYQNAAYAMSGLVLEKVSGKTTDQLLKEMIFEPLGMDHATTSFEEIEAEENIAYPHVYTKKGWVQRNINHKYYNAILAGGINASISDMGKWLQFLLDDDQNLLQPETKKTILSPKIREVGHSRYYQKWRGNNETYYGYGWRIHEMKDSDNNEYEMIHHGGFVNGYRSEIAFIKEKGIGICVLLSNANSFSKSVIPDLMNIAQENRYEFTASQEVAKSFRDIKP